MVIGQSFVFVYVTVRDEIEARKVAGMLLEKKLIGCANFFAIKSMYRWKGKVVDGREWVVILKTVRKLVPVVRREIERVHSYDIPCVTVVPVEPNGTYGKWLESELRENL